MRPSSGEIEPKSGFQFANGTNGAQWHNVAQQGDEGAAQVLDYTVVNGGPCTHRTLSLSTYFRRYFISTFLKMPPPAPPFRGGCIRTAVDLSGKDKEVRDVGVAGSNPVTPTIDLEFLWSHCPKLRLGHNSRGILVTDLVTSW
jgi:hypothetical protein